MSQDETRRDAAVRMASRWLSGLKSRRVRQASRLRLTVWLRSETEQHVAAEALVAAGALSASTSSGDRPPGTESAAVWAYSVVACYPAEHSMVVKGLQEVNRLVGTPGGGVPFHAEAVMDAAWSNDREGMYQPVKIQDHFWLVPVWSDAPDPDAVNIVLEPTYAAWPGKGTVDGLQHPATILVLKYLASGCLEGGERVMDYGVGSGVLAIAALKFGAEHAVGVDIDPVCVSTTRKNMERNGIGQSRFTALCGGDISQPEPLEQAGVPGSCSFEVCMANVLEGDMQRLRMRILGYLKPGGLFILSGMLAEQVPEVMANFSPYLTAVETEELSGWTRITGRLSDSASETKL